MNNTTTNSKCSNLGIVMECAEISEENHERQALLMGESNKSPVATQSLDKMKKDESEETPKTQPDKTVTVHEFVDDGNGGSRPKKRITPVHPSRVERSRLSLITFLNNITAPPIRMEANNSSSASSGKTRSQSISISSPAHSQIANTTTATDESAAASFPPVQACDKLSIKSGVSMAASSNSGPSESMFSAGSGTSLSCSKATSKHRECPICCVRQSAGNFQKLKCCPHLACKTCLIKYLTTEIMESRTNISCPECPAQLHASDIYALLSHQPELIDRFELFALRRALSTDPDTRWCPAPDCIYAVIAQSCAACPQLKCERCSTMFCYHCKNTWHPSQTCDQARSKAFFNNHPPRTSPPNESTENDVMKACPRCGALIMKMNDGSCNHMQCALCNAEFCWLCLKQINELHYLSPTGCTFWGKKPWTRKKKLLWQIGTLIGAPLGIALIAGLAVPGIICGVPIFVGRKTYQRFSNLTRTKRQLVTAMSVVGSLLVSPVLAVMAVGVGVPIMLAYVYGVVPLSLCRNGACGGSNGGDGGNGDDEEVAYGEEVMAMNPDTNHARQSEEKSSKLSFHHRRQSIASSGLASLGDKPNTEDASIAAIAGSQYNYDNRSVHTIWSSGQYAGHISETAQEATSYNNDDAENASTMENMNNTTTNSKCSNLGIVMECAEISEENHERQALLMGESNKSPVATQSLDKMKKDESEETPKTQPDKTVTVHEFVDDGNGGSRPKKRITPVHPSRVERSRLSLITFLNNITAPPIRMEANNSSSASSGKTRSQSISISSPAHSQIANTTTATDESAAASFPPVQACDKLSIKSGVSMAASSNSGPSESMFSAGSGTSLSCSKATSKHRECPICCVRQSAGNFQKLKCCPHLACKTCLIKYLTTEIMESRTNISCPECPAQLHASDIYALLSHQPELIDRFELFALRRALSTDPDTRWCPAPDCIYAVIAQSCAACPQLKCERCSTMFCYHCKNTWHPSQTCDQARSKAFFNNHPPRTSPPNESTENDVMKACPRCGALIMKMNDGSCNHMQCALCNAEFCWLCLKQINELHYLSPTGCTFWGKKPWTRKKKLLWQIGTLIGAPLGIALIAGLAVPGIICGVPIFVGRKTYQRFSNLTRTKRQLVTAMSVVGSLLVSPVLAVMAVGVGVPIMLAYVYGVVPLSLCRNGACGGSNGGDGGNGDDEEVAYGEEVMAMNPDTNHARQSEEKSSKLSFHHRRQSIASSGLASLGDKPNTEDASIAAIAGSQYNYDNRSVHTIWSSGQYAGHISETAQEATSYNNDDAENASTMACCSASIVAQAERRSLTGSNDGSFKTRPRSSISNSRGTSEEPGRIPAGKLMRKAGTKVNLLDNANAADQPPNARKMTDTTSVTFLQHSSISIGGSGPSHQAISIDGDGARNSSTATAKMGPKKEKKHFSFQSFIRHPVDTLFPKKRNSNGRAGGEGGADGEA